MNVFAQKLEFSEIEGNPPTLNCNLCSTEFTSGGVAADVPITDDRHLTIVMCSTICAEHFKDNPYADEYIFGTICRCLNL